MDFFKSMSCPLSIGEGVVCWSRFFMSVVSSLKIVIELELTVSIQCSNSKIQEFMGLDS